MDIPATSISAHHVSAIVPTFCAPGTVWIELIKGVPTAVVALIIGIIAAGVAYRQYQVARAKLNLDLFERRFAIFQKTWEYLSSAVQVGPPASAFSTPFDNLIPQASFLFGKEIEEYMRTASKNMTELWFIDKRTAASGDAMAPADIARHTELTNWFFEEASRGVKQIFSEYLDFGKWR